MMQVNNILIETEQKMKNWKIFDDKNKIKFNILIDSLIKWNYNAGCTCDSTDLPHHESSSEEINSLIEQFKQFLHGLQLPPTIITISRSSSDDYCPVDQVEDIQIKVLNALKEVYGPKLTNDPIHYYKDQEWNM